MLREPSVDLAVTGATGRFTGGKRVLSADCKRRERAVSQNSITPVMMVRSAVSCTACRDWSSV
jgi:hypothetical protein